MLIGIPSCLGPQLLYNLRAMGHGDEIAIVDANYPSLRDAKGPGGLVRADGVGLVELLDAILGVMPLDDDVVHAAVHTTLGNDGVTLGPVHHEIAAVMERRGLRKKLAPMAGASFYDRVRGAHTLLASGEPRLYANIILRKGVIRPE